MKNFIKSILVAATLGSAIGLTSCGGHTDNTGAETEAHDDHAGHEHIFACPMHPEVTGKEGDKCPKCGMALEHNDDAGKNTNTYIMELKTTPEKPEAGKAVILSLTPRVEGNNTAQVPLDLQHGQKIHIITVSDDLSYFDHIHPEYNADGSYKVETKFPNGGKYLVYSDYKPAGADHQLGKTEVKVDGKEVAVVKHTAKTTAAVDGYTIKLVPSTGTFVTGEQLHIAGVITKNGKAVPADQLEDYLEAKAHVVVISTEGKDYLHVHPDVENGNLDLHATFDKPGIYRAWVQFQTDGKVHTADFTLDVKQGSGKSTGTGHDHDHGDHDHDDHSGHKH